MSSSDAQALRFLRAFVLAAGAIALLVLALCWTLDPSGLLRGAGFPAGLCAPGIRTGDERYTKPAMARVLQPDEVLIGSSRTGAGFSPGSFPGRRVTNLAVSGATLDEVIALARHASDEASVRRIWLGLDFGAFIERNPPRPALHFPRRGEGPRVTALRYGLLDPRGLRIALRTLLSPGTCFNPPFSTLGFARHRRESRDRPMRIDRRVLDGISGKWRVGETERRRLYAGRLDALDDLLADLHRRGIPVIVYLSPTTSPYRQTIARAGLAPVYASWRLDLRSLASRHGAILVESDRPVFLAGLAARRCGGVSVDCLFHDPVHFRPEVGELIVRAALD